MAFHIKDPAADLAARRLAHPKGRFLTETVREALGHECARAKSKIPLLVRLAPFRALRGAP